MSAEKRSILIGAAITAVVAALCLALGCRLSGDTPFTFLRRLFTLDYVPSLEAGASLLTVALFGFLTSFHCIGMCGGIVLSQCADCPAGPVKPGLLYQGGRILSCTLVGALAGALGSVVSLNGYLKGLVPLVCALVMLLMGLRMLGLFRWLGGRSGVEEASPGLLGRVQTKGAFVVGFVTGFLPCGMLQLAQVYALGTGSVLLGAAAMLVFSVTSAPVLFAFGALAGSLTLASRKVLLKAAALVVLWMGVRMLLKGLRLMGVLG